MTTTFGSEAYHDDEMLSPFASSSVEQPTPPSSDRPCGCRGATSPQMLLEQAPFPLAHESLAQAAPEAGELWVPGAERVANPRSAGGSYVPGPWRFVFHTIEGEPGEAGFRRLAARHTNPPHLWAMPSANLLLQTIPLDRSAYALARPGSVQTNRRRAIQVEVDGYAAKMGALPQDAIDWLAERLLAPVARLVPINLERVLPTGGVSCYGHDSSCRLTAEQWQSFDGVCGHQHVPDNKHWDPGLAPLLAIADRARQLVGVRGPRPEKLADHDGPAFAAETDEDGTPTWTGNTEPRNPTDGRGGGRAGLAASWTAELEDLAAEEVRGIQISLNKLTGANLVVDGILGPATDAAIRDFQRKQGLVADGIVGPLTRAALDRAATGAPPAPTAPPPPATPGGPLPSTVGVFDGKTVASWLIPHLTWARQNGWQGRLNSGWRSPEASERICFDKCQAPSCPGTCAGRASNHSGDVVPRGAIDVSDEARFAELMTRCPHQPRIFNDLPNDRIDFSATGH